MALLDIAASYYSEHGSSSHTMDTIWWAIRKQEETGEAFLAREALKGVELELRHPHAKCPVIYRRLHSKLFEESLRFFPMCRSQQVTNVLVQKVAGHKLLTESADMIRETVYYNDELEAFHKGMVTASAISAAATSRPTAHEGTVKLRVTRLLAWARRLLRRHGRFVYGLYSSKRNGSHESVTSHTLLEMFVHVSSCFHIIDEEEVVWIGRREGASS